MRIRNVQDLGEWRLCAGCGACAYVCSNKNIQLINIKHYGIRPFVNQNDCGSCHDCIEVCPGLETVNNDPGMSKQFLQTLRIAWGSIGELWEGYAADPEVRLKGSSGGLATALSLYCIEKEGMHGVLHIGSDEKLPLRNKTFLSQNYGDLIARTGSRYSPASPCEGLSKIENAPTSCVFIGKPCDVAGLRKAQFLKPMLDQKVGLAIGIFCAGTPSTQGTLDLLRNLNIDSDKVAEIRYRGDGWPGEWTVKLKGDDLLTRRLSYIESWGFLERYRPFRCYLCPDGTSEFADISCGDPWYRKPEKDEQGHSLVLVRTEKGRKILEGATKAGYLFLKQAEPWVLEASQGNLLAKRRAIWGRIIAMRVFGIPTPRYKGFPLFSNWCELPLGDKVRSILGTARRIIKRKYYKPQEMEIEAQKRGAGVGPS